MVVWACFRVAPMVTAWCGCICPSEAVGAVLRRSSFYAWDYIGLCAIALYTQFSIRSLVAVGLQALIIILNMSTVDERLL